MNSMPRSPDVHTFEHMKNSLLIIALVAAFQWLPAQKNPHAKSIKELDALFSKAIADFNVPGMAVAIIKDDQVLLSKGYGVKQAGKTDPIDDKTLFAIASNSKAFTSAALAMLVDEGKLRWDDKVRKYLPWFTLYDPYVSEAFTVRDLLCHRSGLATFSGDLIWYGTTHSREEVIRRAQYLEPVFGFREAYGYSNIMFLAAGEIVRVISGQSWDDFVKQRIFQPLGMSTSNTSIKDFGPASNKAMPHNEKNGTNEVIDYVDWDNIGPAGSINSSVSEVTQWLRLQLGKGTLDGKKIWSEARTWEMWENQTPKPVGKWQRENMPSRHFNGYGLGWELMEYGGYKVVSHGGGYDGMISKTMMVPELNLGFVILTNNINSLPSCLAFEILDEFCRVQEKKDWTGMFLGFKKDDEKGAAEQKAAAEAARAKNTKPSLELKNYCGTYRSEMYGDVEVREENGTLSIDFKPTALFKGTLTHWHYDTFQLNWTTKMMLPSGQVTFVLDASGQPMEMRVVVDNPDFDFTELKLFRTK